MRETPTPGGAERSIVPEGAANREQVMQAFNNAAFSWSNKISRLHKDIDASREIDDLSDTGLLTAAQRKQLADFRTFQKGVRGLSGGDFLILHDAQRRDALTTTFRDSDSGEVYQREEGLDVSGLIASAREDVDNTRVRLAEQRASRYSSFVGISHLESTLNQQESQLYILEKNSVPYVEAFPNALDENNPQERARIAEEARRIWKFPLTNTGSDEGNWQAAKARLGEARLLQVPPKEEGLKVVPLTVDTSTRVLGDSEPLPLPISAKPGVVHEMGHAMYGIPHSRVREDHPVGADVPTPTIHDPNFVPAPFGGSVADEETGAAPEVPKTGEVISPPGRERRSPGSPPITIDGQFSELGGPGYASRFGVFIRDLIDAGAQGADVLVNRIREFRRRWGERESKSDPATARKVDTLMRTKPTDAQRGKCRLAVLPLVLLLLAGIPRDTIGAAPSNGQDFGVPAATAKQGELGSESPPEVRNPFMTENPTTIQEFTSGKGLGNEQFSWNDFTMRGDYQDKIQPNNPNANPYNIEGYSVKGLTEADIAKAMNPDVASESAQLVKQGEAHSESDPKMLRTLELLKQQLDTDYGAGTYDQMVKDFTSRMRSSIIFSKENSRPGLLSPVVDDDKIVLGNIRKMELTTGSLNTWLRLKLGSNLDPFKWQEISENITKQVREETNQ